MYNYGYYAGVPPDLDDTEDNTFYDDCNYDNQYNQFQEFNDGTFSVNNDIQNTGITLSSPESAEEIVYSNGYPNQYITQQQQQEQQQQQPHLLIGQGSDVNGAPFKYYVASANSSATSVPLIASEMGLKPSSTIFIPKSMDATPLTTPLPMKPLLPQKQQQQQKQRSIQQSSSSSSSLALTSIPSLLYPPSTSPTSQQPQLQSLTSQHQHQQQTTKPMMILRDQSFMTQEQPTNKKMKITNVIYDNSDTNTLQQSSLSTSTSLTVSLSSSSSNSSSGNSSSNSSPSNTTMLPQITTSNTNIIPNVINTDNSTVATTTTIANIPILSAPTNHIGTLKFKIDEKINNGNANNSTNNATTSGNNGDSNSNILFDACCKGAVGFGCEGVKRDGYKALSRDKLLKVSSEEMNKYEIYVKTHYRLTPQQEEEIRHQKRLVKSREFAKKSRQRVQEQICALEGKNTALERQVSDLELQNKALKLANTSLLKENAQLKDLIKKLNHNAEELRFNSSSTPTSVASTPQSITTSNSIRHHNNNNNCNNINSNNCNNNNCNDKPMMTIKKDDDGVAKGKTSSSRFNAYILFFVLFSALTVLVYDLPPTLLSDPFPSFSSRGHGQYSNIAISGNSNSYRHSKMGVPGSDGGLGYSGGLRKLFIFDSMLPFKQFVPGKKGYSDSGQRIIVDPGCECACGNRTFANTGASGGGGGVDNDWIRDSNGKRTDFLSVLFIYPLCYLIIAGRKKNKVRNKR